MTTKKIWDYWEDVSVRYLKSIWYEILDRNFKFSVFGEVDIIAKDWDEFVFVEVKYRRNNSWYGAEDAVTFSKKWKLLKTIQYYCKINNIYEDDIRFDVITINWERKTLRHYKRESLE